MFKTSFRPKAIFAQKWEKNGDHILDYTEPYTCPETGETFTPEQIKEKGWEGQFVRYYRHPEISGEMVCGHCDRKLHDHGYIERAGVIVCPGDVIIRTENDAIIFALDAISASELLMKDFP